MNKSDEIVFAPSIEWFRRKAKLLRKRIGPDSLSHSATLDLLAKMYGFLDWTDFVGFKNSDMAFETGWDTGLNEKALDERRYLQSSTLTMELGLSEVEALQVLADVPVSQKAVAAKLPELESPRSAETDPKLILWTN